MAKIHEAEDRLIAAKHELERILALPTGSTFDIRSLLTGVVVALDEIQQLRKQLNRAQFGRFA